MIEKLTDIKGPWPKRQLSQEELLAVYKEHFSFGSRREYLFLLSELR